MGHVVTSVVGLGALDDPFVSRGAINRKEENINTRKSRNTTPPVKKKKRPSTYSFQVGEPGMFSTETRVFRVTTFLPVA